MDRADYTCFTWDKLSLSLSLHGSRGLQGVQSVMYSRSQASTFNAKAIGPAGYRPLSTRPEQKWTYAVRLTAWHDRQWTKFWLLCLDIHLLLIMYKLLLIYCYIFLLIYYSLRVMLKMSTQLWTFEAKAKAIWPKVWPRGASRPRPGLEDWVQ